METGIKLITKERYEQIEKHNRSIEKDVKFNSSYQLTIAASKLLSYPAENNNHKMPPNGWDIDIYKKMQEKPYKERLIIAGALIAAELDRLNYIEDSKKWKNPDVDCCDKWSEYGCERCIPDEFKDQLK